MASDNFAPAATPKVGFSLSCNDLAGGGQRQKWGNKGLSSTKAE
jgi:hypothetical protein